MERAARAERAPPRAIADRAGSRSERQTCKRPSSQAHVCFFEDCGADHSRLQARSPHAVDLHKRLNWVNDVRRNGRWSDSTYTPLLPWLTPNERVDIGAEFLASVANIKATENVCSNYAPGDKAASLLRKKIAEVLRFVPNGEVVPAGEVTINPVAP